MNKFITVLIVVLFFSCADTEPRKPVVRKTGTFLKESIQRNIDKNKLEEEILTLRIKKDTLNNYLESEQGFWYFYVQKDTLNGQPPKKGDEVVFGYEVKRINDSIVYSEDVLGDIHYIVDKQELISGLQDGIKLMRKGEIVTFLFPSHKAFGYSGAEGINPNEPLIYTVHLKEIIVKN
ncbi:MAG: gliding motility-associated peptidyl-prolyl isomerase GldI [Flavobacteriaceae bacterium]|nr:gliding motility-associated peptidyl-prolyl isomerase GldI [Flavobacteriaceae bacterium]